MKMMKIIRKMLLGAAVFIGLPAMAQSVEDGIDHLYAERNKSALEIFKGLVAKDPNDIEATYWLGQTHMIMDDLAAARSLYEKALLSNGNAPLLLVGMGHVELHENKPNEARQRFEAAISMSRTRRGDDPEILNAVGRANVDAADNEYKSGDANYAVEKLRAAIAREDENPDIYLNLGNAFRKLHNGSYAVLNYIKSTEADPKFAIGHYRIAKIYETQKNWEPYVEELNKAIAADEKFAPAYYELYYYNLGKLDFAQADMYAKKFIEHTDPDVQNGYLVAQTEWAKKNYDAAIAKALEIVAAAGEKTRARTYKLLAYSYMDKGDTMTAKQYIDTYFEKAKTEEVIGQDYILKAEIYAALPDNENPNIVRDSYLQAAAMDSVLENKILLLQQGIDKFKASGKKIAEAELRLALYELKTDPSPAEFFFIGLPFYQGGAFERADSAFQLYSQAYPDSIYGHLWSARARAQIDTAMEMGLAIPSYEQTLRVAEMDKERFKSYGVESGGYLATYYNNILKSRDTAIMYLEKALEFDPENAAVKRTIEILQGGSQRSGSKPGKPKPSAEVRKPEAMRSSEMSV